MDWIIQNSVPLLVVTIIVIAVVVMMWNNKKGLLARAALYAVSKAEETWGSDTGRIKFAEVYTYLSKQYPLVTFFFTEKQLTQIIEDALTEMKKILANKTAKQEKEAAASEATSQEA